VEIIAVRLVTIGLLEVQARDRIFRLDLRKYQTQPCPPTLMTGSTHHGAISFTIMAVLSHIIQVKEDTKIPG
jgi:hypothetical protein